MSGDKMKLSLINYKIRSLLNVQIHERIFEFLTIKWFPSYN